MEGPWCDVWSLGVLLQMMILGRGNAVCEVSGPCMPPVNNDLCLLGISDSARENERPFMR